MSPEAEHTADCDLRLNGKTIFAWTRAVVASLLVCVILLPVQMGVASSIPSIISLPAPGAVDCSRGWPMVFSTWHLDYVTYGRPITTIGPIRALAVCVDLLVFACTVVLAALVAYHFDNIRRRIEMSICRFEYRPDGAISAMERGASKPENPPFCSRNPFTG